MFDDASQRTWGRPGGCGLGFDPRARTRTGMCPKRQSVSDVLSDHSALCAAGRWLFVGLAPASVWGGDVAGSGGRLWLVLLALNLLWSSDLISG